MKGRWRKDKRPGEGGGCSASFPSSSSWRSAAGGGDATFWSRPRSPLSGTPRCSSSCRAESSSASGSAEKSTSAYGEDVNSGSSGTRGRGSREARNSNPNSRGLLRAQKNSSAETPHVRAGLGCGGQSSSSSSSNGCRGSCAATTPLLEEDLHYFSNRRVQAAAGTTSETAAVQPPAHLKNAAHAAAQSLRQSEQLLCDGAARAALQQALEGGSIYLPALCCSHDDFTIFEALMKDLLVYALRKQEREQQRQQQQQQTGEQEDQRMREIPTDKEDYRRQKRSLEGGSSSGLKREDGENPSMPSPRGATSDCLSAADASAAAAEASLAISSTGCDSGGGPAPAEKNWRGLLRPSSLSAQQAATSSSAATADAAPEDAAGTAEAGTAGGRAAAGGANAGAAGAAGASADATTTAGGGGVINWSCHLKHENPSFSPTFQSVVEKLSSYFCVEVYASRLNMYMDGTHWKPLHHDSHAYSSQQQQREDFTVGASFGATRALEFVHVRSTPHNGSRNHEEQPAAAVRFLFPQRNGDVFAFNADVNRRFKHGVPPAPAPTSRLAAAKPAAPSPAARADARRIPRADAKAAGTSSPAAPTQKEAELQNGIMRTSGGGAVLNGTCTREMERGASAKTVAAPQAESWKRSSSGGAAAAEGSDGERAEKRQTLEDIAATEAAAATRTAAAATDGNGPRFSIIVWGRRKQLNDRNASLKELAAASRSSRGKISLS